MKRWWTSVCLWVLVGGVGALSAACDHAASEQEAPPPRWAPVLHSEPLQPPADRRDSPRPAPAGGNPYLMEFARQRRDTERRLREEPNPYMMEFERQQRDIERRLREEPNPYLRLGYGRNR